MIDLNSLPNNTARIRRVIGLLFFLAGLNGITPSFAQAPSTSVYLPLVANRFDPAWLWQQPQTIRLSPYPNTSDPLLLAIDAVGGPHVLYDTSSTPRYIYHTYLTAQGWITPTQVADTLGASYTLFPPVRDESGGFHLLWRNWLGSGVTDPYRLMYSAFANGKWSAEEQVARFSSNIQGMVRPDPTGVMRVTSVSTFYILRAQHFIRTPSGWSSPIDISIDYAATWVWPDYFGGIHFYDGESYPQPSVVYSYWLDGEFQVNGHRIAGELVSGDSQLDGQNNLNLFRRAQVPVPGGNVYGIYHRCLAHDLTWSEEQVLSGYQDTLSPLVKAEDGRSRIALAWQERQGNVVQVRVFDECKLKLSSNTILPLEFSWELRAVATSQAPPALCLLARRAFSFSDYLVQCALLTP